MEHAKFANGSGHKLPIGRSPSPAEQDLMDAARLAGGKKAVRKKAAPRKAKPAGPVPAENSLPRKIGTAAEVKSDHRGAAASSPYRKSAGCTIATNASRPDGTNYCLPLVAWLDGTRVRTILVE